MPPGHAPGSRRFALHALPGLAVLLAYRRAWLRPDLVAGFTVGAMLIPQSMAYAELAGLAPEHGFYAVILALVVYALVGTSRHLGVGPEPGTAILAATGVGAIATGDPDRYVALMATLALVVSAICIVGAAARLGFLATMLSKPVLVGYITGVGLTLVSSQLAAFTGVAISADSFFPRVAEFARELGDIDPPTLLLGSATLVLILVLRWRMPTVPGAAIGVVLATIVVAVSGTDAIAVVGEIPAGLPSLGLPEVSAGDIAAVLPVAAGIALVGFTDNVLTGRSIATGRGYRIEPNRELLALGLTNLTAGVSQGFPVSSSASRTAVPASLGSHTQLVSLVASAFVVVTLLFLRPVLSEIPRPALAAVIISAAIAIIDVAGFRSLWLVSRQECALAAAAALGVMVFDVLVGVLIAVSLSILVALGRIALPHDAVLGDEPGLDGWVAVDEHPAAVTEPGLVVYRFDAPLFFLNAGRFVERVQRVLAENPGVEEWVVLDFEGVGAVDATAVDALAELVDELRAADVATVAIARANGDALDRLRRGGLLEPAGPLREFATINAAVRAFRGRPIG